MMNKIQLPLWIRHGECLLTTLCAISIGAVTLLFAQTPWGQKTPLQTHNIQQLEQRLGHTQAIQWPQFAWQHITPAQLQQRILDWLLAPQRHWQSQHQNHANNTQQHSLRSYSATLHLSAEELNTLWQVPSPVPAWPGWVLAQASGAYSNDHWKIKLHWHTTPHLTTQETLGAQPKPSFWHTTNTPIHTSFADTYWQPTATQATPSTVNNTQTSPPITPLLPPTSPAYLVGLLQSKSVSGAWLQVSTSKPFFVAKDQSWQGFLLGINPQGVVYLQKGTLRWQLNKCLHQSPCLIKTL